MRTDEHDRRTHEGPTGSWFWRSCGLQIGVVVGWFWGVLMAYMGWVTLGASHGRSVAGAPPDPVLGSMLWAASALSMFGLPCVASHGLWPLRRRLAVAVPLAVAWFVVGRFVLPAPEVPGALRSVAEAIAVRPAEGMAGLVR
ncbi:hypothetical protein [Cellulomonas pakistanensis]|uniref:Uncharacterized protein n=1 Tax=Cellulomonas pakistanensis TaxID=992287 RepID=A0A919P875_9CELL|nr:hypothetical protein [Cellulomonas pakistanensis]GIG36164.1 hypothetical protein Cpa01nite_15450 [Cellulomonas pakistanensis]